MKERCARHFECVLDGWLALGFLGSQGLEGGYMVVWVAAERGNCKCKAIASTEDAQLRDRILLEELSNEGDSVAEGEEVAGWTQVFFRHGGGKVEDED